MKSRLLYIFLLVFGTLWACSDEPEFPDPGLDATRTTIDTVRRDTMDSYLISMDISAPNGVDKIQLLNGRNYNVLEEFTEYGGQKNFTFEYNVDLREIVNDTTLLYIVKVIDRNMRSYNKGFTLNVKKFSAPDIKVVGGEDVLGLVNSVFELKALFETGLNTIDSYRVYFEDQLLDEGSFPDTLMHEYKYKKVVDVKMEMGEEYRLRVELTDDKGQVGKKEMKLLLVELSYPEKVSVYASANLNRDVEFFYNAENRLDSLYITRYLQRMVDGYMIPYERYEAYKFEYNLEGMVSEWRFWDENTETSELELEQKMVYTYEDGKIKYIAEDPGPADTDIEVFSWYDHGGIAGYWYGMEQVEDVHYVQELSGDGFVFAEWWPNSARGEDNRVRCEDMTAILIPTYFPELPCLAMTSNSVDKDMWRDLFFLKYVFERGVYVAGKNAGKDAFTVVASTDSQGCLTQYRRNVSSTSYRTYVFHYAE